ncbi:MAG: zinc-ribbon domain-containing protein [Deltaproteobacteria bacterium]|nr:zinc-ribbon domain-containing protein [Deltaproteobacteria bacterium]
MPLARTVCPACGAALTYDSRKALKGTGGKVACPYEGLAYAELRAGHDRIYFGPWRKLNASPIDVRRVYHRIGRHLSAIGQVLRDKDLPAATRDLAKAVEAFQTGDPREGDSDVLRLMDHALSYAHRAIDDLLHEEGLPPHNPMDFAEWYDAAEVPFRDEW